MFKKLKNLISLHPIDAGAVVFAGAVVAFSLLVPTGAFGKGWGVITPSAVTSPEGDPCEARGRRSYAGLLKLAKEKHGEVVAVRGVVLPGGTEFFVVTVNPKTKAWSMFVVDAMACAGVIGAGDGFDFSPAALGPPA